MDGDVKRDVVMRDAEGNVKVWLMDDINIKSEFDIPTTDITWQLFPAGDFDGDGSMELA